MDVPATIALLQAAERSDRAGMFAALRRRGSPNATMDGNPLIMVAALSGDEELVWALLNAGASVDAREANLGFTTLHQLALHGRTLAHRSVAQLLLRRGAEVDAQSPGVSGKPGPTPLDLAVRFKNEAFVELLKEHGARGSHAEAVRKKRQRRDDKSEDRTR